ncbi:MAG: SDR family NAD(P)-dependent oxidoreductase, partial [Pirellulales bacterium]
MIDLTGHNALITGSTQGVGQAIAVAMAQAGANVVIHGLHDNDSAQATLQRCLATGQTAKLLTADLASDVQQATQQLC